MSRKILFCTGIFPPDIGGPATMLGALAHELTAHGFEVKILTFSEKADSTENVIRIPKNKLYSHILFFLKLLSLSFWADVLYATDTWSVGYFAYLIKKLTGKKYILRFAGDSAWDRASAAGWTKDYLTEFQAKTYGPKIERLKRRRTLILTQADRVIAVSCFLADHAERIGVPKGKLDVIYNSVDFIDAPGSTEAGKRVKDDCGPGAKVMLTIGRLIPGKGVAGIIKLIPGLIEKVGKIVFLVAGDGPELRNLESLAESLGIRDKIRFLGRVDHDDIMGYLKASDIFVLNTEHEGLSHTVLEAMKAGIPVVTTRVGGNPETIKDGVDGLLVEFNDTDRMRDAIIKVLSDEELAKLLVENAHESLKKFDWTKNVEQTIQTINQTI